MSPNVNITRPNKRDHFRSLIYLRFKYDKDKKIIEISNQMFEKKIYPHPQNSLDSLLFTISKQNVENCIAPASLNNINSHANH